MMPKSDTVSPQGSFQPPQEPVPELPRRRLQGEALPRRIAGYIGAFAEQGHPQPKAQVSGKIEIVPGLPAPDAVLEMGRVQGADPALVPQPHQFQQQRSGVGTAGESAHHSLPPREAAGPQRLFRHQQHGYQTPIIVTYIIPFAPLFDKSFL